MRIVLDLQGVQSESRFRGIGRYSLALAQTIAREADQDEVWLALSGRFPDSIEPIKASFADIIPAECIRVFELPGPVAELNPANTWRMQAAELLREKFLADLRPDLIHVSTLFEGSGNEVVASVGRLDTILLTAATLYDLIPLLHPASYLTDPMRKRHYMRRLQSLKRADLLLAISESSRQEAVDVLGIPSSRIVNIAGGVQPWFRPVEISSQTKYELTTRFSLKRPFVLFTGGAEPRKNLERLVAAFGLLPAELRAGYQLAVTGELNEKEQNRFISLARKQGLADEDLVFLGYASDEDLRLLYTACSLFIFPSLHEGLGLPLLEAMACGAAVIGSDCTSIPEIINRRDALFDPLEPRDICRRIAEVLSNADLLQSLKAWACERAKLFTWEASAHAALYAFEALYAGQHAARTVSVCARSYSRPLLAFVSPLPPEPTGIAGYSARLLANLARYYEVICIVDQLEVTDPWVAAEFTIRDVRWFEANGARFERVLYQFGNSPAHKHMFGLNERHPGVVVLHDFYLSSALNWMADSGYAPDSLTKALYDSHGFSALRADRVDGREASMTTFPCNAAVLRESIGVIVHSSHAMALACAWYGDRASVRMRQVPFIPFPPETSERLGTRNELSLPQNAFVTCSFGWLAPVKLNDRLLQAWLSSPLAEDENCFLIFVGENHGGEYGQRLMQVISASDAASRIRITGYVEPRRYRDYLAAADLAVQLRKGSRGETSATIFDCLSQKVPLVINAHGSAAELPEDAVMKLDDSFSPVALASALVHLRADPGLRQSLATRGALYLNEVHHPERVAELYLDVIEELYRTSSRAREQKLLKAIARASPPAEPTKADLAAVAIALATNREKFGLPQFLVDVTNVVKSDLRTGIERATRGLLMALISDPPPGYRVEPVRAVASGYVYARRFACECLVMPEDGLTDDAVETDHGDIFLGMDWCADVVPSLKPWFLAQRRHGVRIVFVAYDMLPLLRPELFPSLIPPIATDWINTVAEVADGVVCISRTVTRELYEWLCEAKLERLRPLSLGYFHLGADLHATLPTEGLSEDAFAILTKVRSRPSFLMVGTVEPRKGYRQALAAMELLWADGADANLVIIGKKGWMVDDLVERIQRHPEHDNRLFWLQGVSDEMLEQVYLSARALLAASEGEGFGLPLIEAAQHGLPIIARDIAVFREVAGEHAYYFRGEDVQTLADALRAWLSLGADAVPAPTRIPCLTWQESCCRLLEVVLGKKWYLYWPDAATAPTAWNSLNGPLLPDDLV